MALLTTLSEWNRLSIWRRVNEVWKAIAEDIVPIWDLLDDPDELDWKRPSKLEIEDENEEDNETNSSSSSSYRFIKLSLIN